MLLEQERNAVVEYGKMLISHGLTRGTGGNISILNREQGLFAISPSGMDYLATMPEDVVVMDLDGNVVESTRKPSSELAMHRLIYLKRPEMTAVVHTHSPYATAFSCTLIAQELGLPPISYLVMLAGASVRCTPYVTFGTEKLATLACEYMKDRKAVLLGNHGLLAADSSIKSAFEIAEQIEFACELYCHTQAFGYRVNLLTPEQISEAQEKFKKYGQ